mmetsp:Transcript_7055/g.17233  ORF Transcript_7055/g.17233 Transcript_7055/m.17233 type:complete len:445 (+) Transcript_7055:164-1498(+)
MTIRLDALRTFGKNLKDWFRLTIPLVCVIRYLSDRPIDWLFFWMGWKFLRFSTTYFFDNNDGDETVEFENERSRSKHEDDNHAYRTRLESFATSRNSSAAEASYISLTSLPSTVLSDVACYLYPRDVLCLDTVLRSDLGLRNRGDESDGNAVARLLYDHSIGRDIWKRLWYRDYGDVLLQWKVSRDSFRHSLMRSSPLSTYDRLEERLSDHLDEITGTTTSTITMKYFYFLFGECYIDYVLARKNTMEECYLGLHGHIFDFTDFAEFHPGLIEPILKECGGDATHYFEDIPHSSGARNIARRLCVVVDHSVFDSGRCGLQFVLNDDGSSKLKDLLRSSNTRPLRDEQNRSEWSTRIVPRRRKWRRHPTLERIRIRFQQERRQHNSQQTYSRNNAESNTSLATMTTEWISSYSTLWRQKESETRIYFDPLAQEWVRWRPAGNGTH